MKPTNHTNHRERIARLWLGAILGAVSYEEAPVRVPPSPERGQAAGELRAAARAAHAIVDDREYDRSQSWLGRLGAAVELLAKDFDLGPQGPNAVEGEPAPSPEDQRRQAEALAVSALVWAAVSFWQDVPGSPWGRCAQSCARLARKLEPAWADTLAPRLGDALRRAMDREADRLWLGYVRSPLVSAARSTQGPSAAEAGAG